MTSYRQRDVVLVRFVFSEGTGFKKRPALVLSSNAYHQGRREVIIAAITSNLERVLVGDTKIEDWRKANLLFPSSVTAVIQTVKREMIERRLGILSEGDFERVEKNLKIVLGFD